MKKTLLTLAALSVAAVSYADVVTFLAADAESSPALEKVTGNIVVMPEGFYFDSQADRKPEQMVKKVIASDNVQISGAIGAANKMDSYVTSGGLRWYTKQSLTFTPASGMAITKIRVRTQTTAQTKAIPEFTTDADNALLQVWTGNSTEPLTFESTKGQNRCFWIEVTTEGTSTQVAKPVCSVANPYVMEDEAIVLSCSTEGATIHYTIDGTEPTAESPVYTAPFTLSKDAIVRAIAVKDGMTASFPFFGEYYVVPAGLSVAKYDFSDWKSLEQADGSKYSDEDLPYAGSNIKILVNDVVFANNGTTFTVNGSANSNTIFMSATFGGVVELRPANTGAGIKIAAKDGELVQAVFVGSIITNINVVDGGVGTYAVSPVNTSMAKWTAPESGSVKELDMASVGDSNNPTYIDQVYVFYKSAGTGVDGVVADENAPVEYFNLQGMRVANPENGIFIKRQGSKVEKVYVK